MDTSSVIFAVGSGGILIFVIILMTSQSMRSLTYNAVVVLVIVVIIMRSVVMNVEIIVRNVVVRVAASLAVKGSEIVATHAGHVNVASNAAKNAVKVLAVDTFVRALFYFYGQYF